MRPLPLPPKPVPKKTKHLLLPEKITVTVLTVLLLLAIVLSVLIQRHPEPTPATRAAKQTAATQKSEAKKAPRYVFPGNKTELAGNYRFVALYGTPDAPVLGVLGEQPVDVAITRAKEQAAAYQPLSKEIIYPTFEIITTIAAGQPTENGDYSREVDIEKIKPWVEAAKAAGVYVILDLQPGRRDFLSQAKQYESLLKEPHVGLALDPEWRLKPDQMHMEHIGSVSADEVNQTSTWLADLCKKNNLPQKVLLLHQFRLSMLENRELIDTSRSELLFVVQMDGQGGQPVKQDTWRAMQTGFPTGMHLGWKNFIDEDKPMLTPAETMQISPQPWYISYQ